MPGGDAVGTAQGAGGCLVGVAKVRLGPRRARAPVAAGGQRLCGVGRGPTGQRCPGPRGSRGAVQGSGAR